MPHNRLYEHSAQMEPLLPEDRDGKLAALALTLIRKAERLRTALHPVTRASVVDLVRSMNSYYSNLIEGHRTTPREIDAAVRRAFSKSPPQRDLQIQHVAHMETQAEMERRLPGLPSAQICTSEFLGWIHERFYLELPETLRRVENERGQWHQVTPGRLRDSEVTVGRHVAPASQRLRVFLARFADFYGPLVSGEPMSLVAAAAAHHRLTWIHPFLDGNGRVARLFTHAWLAKTESDGAGLWTISRGLARRQPQYRAVLANADERRINDLDGRGNLSQRYLAEFCAFFLESAIDQVEFMQELLDLDRMQNRIRSFAERLEAAKELPRGTSRVLCDVFLRGEIPRGDIARQIGASPRTAQKVTGQLLTRRLLVSDSPKGLLRLGFPAEAAGHYFPNLYPAGVE